MRSCTRTLLTAVLLLSSIPRAHAQAPADPSGHWEGLIQWEGSSQIPAGEFTMELDLMKASKSQLTGEISIPGQKVKGRPLTNVAALGQSVSFQIALSAPGDNMFKGVLAPDGKSMSGELSHNGSSLLFKLTRTGDARIEPPARSTAISKQLEGNWNGTLEAPGKSLRLVLTMTNQADGTAVGRMVNLDQGNMEIPIMTITQKAAGLSLDVKAVGGSYVGAVNTEGTELVGTWTQGPLILPLTFRRTVR